MQGVEVKIESYDFDRKIKKMLAEHPAMARGAMRAVNRQIIRDIKKECASRGYLAHKPMPWGDAGYIPNLKQYANRDGSGKIIFSRNAYHMKFIEYGANVRPRHKKYLVFQIDGNFYRSEGFTYPARPLMKPIADSYWKTSKAVPIMERYLQDRYDKLTGGKK